MQTIKCRITPLVAEREAGYSEVRALVQAQSLFLILASDTLCCLLCKMVDVGPTRNLLLQILQDSFVILVDPHVVEEDGVHERCLIVYPRSLRGELGSQYLPYCLGVGPAGEATWRKTGELLKSDILTILSALSLMLSVI